MNPVRTPSARATRSAGIAMVAGFALLALTGCLSIQADLTIGSDAKGSGTFSILLQKQAAKLMGMNDLATFSSGISEQDAAASSSGILASGKCEATETDENFVYECTFSDADFAKDGELWTIKKDGSTIVFQMKNAGSTPTDGADAGEMADLLGGSSLGELTVNVTFPGPIKEITGVGARKTSDTTASVKGTMTDTIDVKITSASSSSAPFGLIIGAVVGLLILAAIVIGLVLFFVRRGRKADAPTDAPVEGSPITNEVGAGTAAATEAIEPARPIPMPGPETPTETVVSEPVVSETVVSEPVVSEPTTPIPMPGPETPTETVAVDDPGPEEKPTA